MDKEVNLGWHMCADFNERSFEFAFNAEFVQRCQPLLLAMPQIPSQHEERSFGYDVALVVTAGAARRSIFLQHKVPSFAQQRWTNNTEIFDLYAGPYYRFYLHKKDGWNQHNRLRQRSISDSSLQLTAYCHRLSTVYRNLNSDSLLAACSKGLDGFP